MPQSDGLALYASSNLFMSIGNYARFPSFYVLVFQKIMYVMRC